MRPVDIRRIYRLSAVCPLAGEPGRLVAALERPDLPSDDTVGGLILVEDDGSTLPLTLGHHDSAPALSPDGRRLAFLRRTPGSPPQVWVIPVSGGEARAVTRAPLGVSELRWLPDGTRIAIAARRPEAGRYGTVPGLPAAAEPPRRITTMKWRLNGTGHLLDRPMSLGIVAVPERGAEPHRPAAPGEARWLDQETDDSAPIAWLDLPAAEWALAAVEADGTGILAIADAHPGRDADLRRDLYRIDLADGGLENLTRHAGSWEVLAAAFASDALVIAARDHGPTGRRYTAVDAALHVRSDSGWRRLTDPAERDIGMTGPLIDRGDGVVLALERARGAVRLVAVGLDGRVAELTPADESVTAAALDEHGRLLVASTAPGRTALLRRDGALLADLGDPGLEAHPSIEHRAEGLDRAAVHGWVLVPEGPGPHPVILTVHGGPFHQYESAFEDEAQILVSAGYAVVRCNPRGSAGYGEAHGAAIRGALGTVDEADVLAFLDSALAAHPRLDRRRIGIMGGSYGGFLTAWILGRSSRFAGGIVERGWFDPDSFTGTSDIGAYYAEEYVGTTPEDSARQNPLSLAARVTAPVLLIHSSEDLRCPIGQSEQYYAALRRAGVPSEFVVFPGENHELTRSGRPRHRVERFEIVLDWWARVFSSDPSLRRDRITEPLPMNAGAPPPAPTIRPDAPV